MGAAMAAKLVHQHQPLFARASDRECGPASRPQRFVAVLRSLLDIMRVMIQTPNYNYVLQPTSNEQHAVPHKSKITGAKEWTIPSDKTSSKDGFCFVGTIPVASSHAIASDPD